MPTTPRCRPAFGVVRSGSSKDQPSDTLPSFLPSEVVSKALIQANRGFVAVVDFQTDTAGAPGSSHLLKVLHHAAADSTSLPFRVDSYPERWDLIAFIPSAEHPIGHDQSLMRGDVVLVVTGVYGPSMRFGGVKRMGMKRTIGSGTDKRGEELG